MSHRVTGAAAQITVGGRVHTVLRGGIVPEGADPAVLDGLVAKGLIEHFDVEAEVEVEMPVKAWNHDRIDAWAAEQDPPIVFVPNEDASKALTKEQKLEQIAAAVAVRSAQQ